MEQRLKGVLIVLAVLVLVLSIGLYTTWTAKTELEKERDKLTKENDSLVSQVNELNQRRQNLELRIQQLSGDLERAIRDKDELDRKYQFAEKARQELAEQVKKLREQKPQVVSQASSLSPAVASSGEDAYWAQILKAKTEAEFQLENIRSELRQLQLTNEKLQRDKAALELEITNLNRDKEELQRKLDYNQKMMDSLAQELVRDKNEKIAADEAVKVIKNENAMLRRQIAAINERKENLERKLLELQDKNTNLEKKVKELDTNLQTSVSQIDTLKKQVTSGESVSPEKKEEAVELPPIVVRPRQESVPIESSVGASLVGKILAVNADNNFVVIDLGEDNGVKIGDVFKVWRDSKQVADIEVIQVRRSISACDIKKEMTPLKVGDLVK